MTEKLVGILEDSTLQIKAQIIATGPRGPQGEQGPPGPQGPQGDPPAHEWDGTSVRFQLPDGSWGDYIDLKGEQGLKGDMPPHEWDGTSIRFQNPDGSWGEWVNLKGESAYEHWLSLGNVGTIGDFLLTLKGDKGDPGSIVDLGTFDSPEQLITHAVMNQLPTGYYTFIMGDYPYFMLLEQGTTYYEGTFHASGAFFLYFKVSIHGEVIELKQLNLKGLMTNVPY